MIARYTEAQEFIQDLVDTFGANEVINTTMASNEIERSRLYDFMGYKIDLMINGHACYGMLRRLEDDEVYVMVTLALFNSPLKVYHCSRCDLVLTSDDVNWTSLDWGYTCVDRIICTIRSGRAASARG